MILTRQTFLERKLQTTHPVAIRLFDLMHTKETNLACALDLTSGAALLEIADRIGPEICVLKTHIDMIEDFTPDLPLRLQELAYKHNFLLFEDRKFADIGSTVVNQYRGGIYKIAEWADIINAHILPGPGIIEGLKTVGAPRGRALLLVAEMSSAGNFLTESYTQAALQLAEAHPGFVIGFISQKKLSEAPHLLHFTPGIQREPGIDPLGQQFHTPAAQIHQGSDILIVGRGIYNDPFPEKAAALYRKEAFDALLCS